MQSNKHNFITHCGPPECIICDQDPAFMSKLTAYFAQQFGFKTIHHQCNKSQITFGTTWHKESQQHAQKYYVWQTGASWIHFMDEAMLTYNSLVTPNLDGLSPFELVYGCRVKIIPDLELTPKVPITVTYREYLENCKNSWLSCTNTHKSLKKPGQKWLIKTKLHMAL